MTHDGGNGEAQPTLKNVTREFEAASVSNKSGWRGEADTSFIDKPDMWRFWDDVADYQRYAESAVSPMNDFRALRAKQRADELAKIEADKGLLERAFRLLPGAVQEYVITRAQKRFQADNEREWNEIGKVIDTLPKK